MIPNEHHRFEEIKNLHKDETKSFLIPISQYLYLIRLIESLSNLLNESRYCSQKWYSNAFKYERKISSLSKKLREGKKQNV